MRGCLPAVLAMAAAVLLACGALLALSGRGILGHLPGAEVVIDKCELPAGGTVRLYEGSLGATTSYWYLASLQATFFAAERTFFQAYGQPPVGSLECRSGAVHLVGARGDVEFSFSVEQIAGELVDRPLGLYYGEPVDGRPSGPAPRLLGMLCGSLLILLGAMTGVAGLAIRRR